MKPGTLKHGVALVAAVLWLSAFARAAESPQTVKVAAVQCSSDLGAVEANRAKLTALCEEAAGKGAKIIVLPEAAVTGYLSQDLRTNWRLKGWPIEGVFHGKDPLPFAETVPGPSTDQFAALAKRLGVYITVPLVEIDRTAVPTSADAAAERNKPRLFNTVCLVSPKGEVVAHYRKLTPWPHPEKSWATPGDRGVQVYDTEYGRVGLAICFDIHTILPQYQKHHLWALLYPIAWVDCQHPAEWFWHTLPQRVAPFGHYVIGANWSVDKPQPWTGYGFSTIIAPGGKVVASAKSLHGSEIVYATIPTAAAGGAGAAADAPATSK
jgi:predicted amidohydrolase